MHLRRELKEHHLHLLAPLRLWLGLWLGLLLGLWLVLWFELQNTKHLAMQIRYAKVRSRIHILVGILKVNCTIIRHEEMKPSTCNSKFLFQRRATINHTKSLNVQDSKHYTGMIQMTLNKEESYCSYESWRWNIHKLYPMLPTVRVSGFLYKGQATHEPKNPTMCCNWSAILVVCSCFQ